MKKLIQKCQKKLGKMANKEYDTIIGSTDCDIIYNKNTEKRKIDAVASCFQMLSTVELCGYEALEEQLITILGKVGPKVYYRYFRAKSANIVFVTVKKEGNASLFSSSDSWYGRIEEISEEQERCKKAFDALSDKTKLKLTLRRIDNIDNNKLLK